MTTRLISTVLKPLFGQKCWKEKRFFFVRVICKKKFNKKIWSKKFVNKLRLSCAKLRAQLSSLLAIH